MSTRLTTFQYKQPKTLDQVFDLVERLQGEKRRFTFCAGGTDVIASLKQQLDIPDAVISLSGLNELKQVYLLPSGKMRIGAMISLTNLINDQGVREYVPSLAETANKIASPQIRNQATIGGNLLVNNRCIFFNQSPLNRETQTACFKANGELCHLVKSATRGKSPLCRARFVSDLVPVLLLLDAKLIIRGRGNERCVALKNFYLKDGIDSNNLGIGELLSYIEIDIRPDRKIRYEKLSHRGVFDFPSLGVAVSIEPDDDSKGSKSFKMGVALTGVHTHPELIIRRSDDFGSRREMVDEICREATRNAVTFQQDLFPRGYRKRMVDVLIRQAVAQLKGDVWT